MKSRSLRLTTSRLRRFAILAALLFAFDGQSPAEPTPSAATVFSLTDPKAKSVHLAGEFNHWSTTATPMERDASGKWSTHLPLRPGKYGYKFVVDGRWIIDPKNSDEAPDGFGGKNSILTVRDPFADPVIEEKAAVSAEAARLFKKKDFAGLEKMAGELRSKKARFSDGLWKLVEFYNGLPAGVDWSKEKGREAWFDEMAEWQQAFPKSITQPVGLANGWIGYAWQARGSGWASEVKEKDWQLFRDRLAKARAILEAAPGRDPNWYGVMQTVALGQNWERADYFRLVAKAAKANPTFYNYYWNAATYLLPRWNGETGEWEKFAAEAAQNFDPEEGLAAYTRIAWSLSDYYSNLFEETAITWPKMKEGFRAIEKQYPDSLWNLNAFCKFAYSANDRETVRELLDRIGEHGDQRWFGFGRLAFARQWADPATPRWRIEPERTLREKEHPYKPIFSIAFSPDGKWIAGGGGGDEGWIALWSSETGAEVWSESVADDPVLSVAFSPNGKLLAAGAAEENQTTHPGRLKVLEMETKNLIAAGEPQGAVWKIAFTPDSQALAVVGGWYDKQAEASLFDLASQEMHSLPWTKGHDHGLRAVAISPNGKMLATDCYQSISVWSIPEKRLLFDQRNTLQTFSRALAFSPDGQRLAVGGMPVWKRSDTQPGGLTLWSTSDWKQVTPREQDDAGGLATVAWSPNGKWIVGGGQDQSVHVWDSATLQSKTIYLAHDGMIWSVAFSPDGRTIASASNNGLIKLWKFP